MENKDLNLSEQFARATRLLMRERLRSFKESGGTDAWRKRLLGYIKTHPGATEKELIKLLERRMSGAEELLLGLEKKGYIVTKGTGNGKTVELTEMGAKEAADYPGIGEAFQVLDDAEKAAFGDYLGRVIAELEKKAGKGDDWEDLPGFWGMGGSGLDHMRRLHEFFRGKDSHGGCGPWDGHGII